jgi:hypothetical protein
MIKKYLIDYLMKRLEDEHFGQILSRQAVRFWLWSIYKPSLFVLEVMGELIPRIRKSKYVWLREGND